MTLKKKPKKKTTSSGLSRKYDTKHVGHEMEFDKVNFDTLTQPQRNILLNKAMSWYAYMYDIKKDYKEPIVTYLLQSGWKRSEVSPLKNVKWEFESAASMQLIRMTQMGWKLNAHEEMKVSSLIHRLKTFIKEYRKTSVTSIENKFVRPKKYDNQDPLLYELEYDFEDKIFEKEIVEYNIYDRIQSLGTSRKILVHYVQPWIESRIVETQTPEFKEQYGVRFRNKLVKVYESMLADVERACAAPKRKMSVRKQRSTPAVKQVRKLNYQKESTEYKVVSINPEKIVGAKSILVFNTKYRKLIWYTSSSSFEVSGSTLKNVLKGEGKTLRKPEEQLLQFVKTNAQSKLLKAFNAVKSKVSEQSPRLNGNCIILKAL